MDTTSTGTYRTVPYRTGLQYRYKSQVSHSSIMYGMYPYKYFTPFIHPPMNVYKYE